MKCTGWVVRFPSAACCVAASENCSESSAECGQRQLAVSLQKRETESSWNGLSAREKGESASVEGRLPCNQSRGEKKNRCTFGPNLLIYLHRWILGKADIFL